MSTYKGIRGLKVRDYTTNPDNPIEGQLWYNTTDNVARYRIPNLLASWRADVSMNTARSFVGSAGTTTSALVFGGSPSTAQTETYNGSSWAETADLVQVRSGMGGVGEDNTSALAISGEEPSANTAKVESWNGTSWSETTDIGTARRYGWAAGTKSLAIYTGGYTSTNVANTEQWNGSAWTEVSDLNEARRNFSGSGGLYTSAIVAGGKTTAVLANSESWNGTSWSETADLNDSRENPTITGTTNTNGLAAGGESPGATANTETWNGTSWSEVANLSTAKYAMGGVGSNSATFAFGGTTGSFSATTEQWSTTQPVGAWATGGDINTARYVPGGGGSQTAGLMFGGQPGGGTSADQTELYNGSTWTEVADLNTARERSASAANSQTAALCITGVVYPGNSLTAANESWNGTSWSEVHDVNTQRDGPFGIGTPSAALIAGGSAPPNLNVTETWNGTCWSTSPATLGQGRKDNESGGAGTSTAGIIAGGNNGSTYGNTEYWNGSAWSEQSDLNTVRSGFALSGGQPAALAMGGSPSTAKTEDWNGVSWQETSDIPTTKRNHAGSKITGSTSALIMGGYVTAAVATTFEWSGSSNTDKTISTD